VLITHSKSIFNEDKRENENYFYIKTESIKRQYKERKYKEIIKL